MIRKISILLALLSMIIFVNAQQTKNKLNVDEYKLTNGLSVYLLPDSTEHEVFGVVITKTGAKNDPATATGLAHYMEHMLFKGTQDLGTTDWQKEKPHIDNIFALYDSLGVETDPEKRKIIQEHINTESLKANEYAVPNELSNLIKGMGGSNLNAGTGPDVTLFYNSFPPNQIEKWLELYSHRFMNPVFRSFQAELEVVYEEKNQYADMFQFSLIEEFQKHFFKNHPYGQQPLIGIIEHLKNPSLTKMYEFFKTYYIANNMALIVSGNFDPEQIKPIIEAKFGKWKSGVVPPSKVYTEDDFNGREYFEEKLSPIRLEILGFRTVPTGHPDEIPLAVCNSILSNASQTGLLDELMLDNQLLAAMAIPLPYNDLGASLFLIVPKIAGQKMEDAEKLVTDKLKKLKEGDFDTLVLNAVKKQLYVENQLSLENLMSRTLLVADAFGRGQKVDDIEAKLGKYLEITKADIVKTANQYYGDNYLAFYSKMGKLDKEKIDKPGYKPVIAKNNVESNYAKEFKNIPSLPPKVDLINFDKNYHAWEVQEGVSLLVDKNLKNDIFTLNIRYGIGESKNKYLSPAAQLMSLAGTTDLSPAEFKMKMSLLGADYSFYTDDSYLHLNIQGMEENLDEILALMKTLLSNPVVEESKVKTLYDNEVAGRKVERSEPANVADALLDFVKYGKNSDYLDRLTLKEIKALKVDELLDTLKYALQFRQVMNYCGAKEVEDIKSSIKRNFYLPEKALPSESPVYNEILKYDKNKVYFVNKKKALQSKIYFIVNGSNKTVSELPVINEFNLYFGGDFSGIVLQEIREYRSMAYSAAAWFSTPPETGHPVDFFGYIATQADKTNDAIDVFDSLVRNLPHKPERMPMIRSYSQNRLITSRPSFRNVNLTIESWMRQGYKEDPAISKMKAYQEITFEDMLLFYEENLQEKPMVVVVVGNKDRIDLDALAKYGEIVELTQKQLFSK